MKIAILSDIHDNLENLNKALTYLRANSIEEIIFCGDFCSPFSAKLLSEFPGKVHAIFGNNDGDKFLILEKTKTNHKFKLYGEYIGDLDNTLEIDGKKIGVSHYPFYAKTMAKTGWYDCVFYGHNHIADKQKFGHCLLLNPGSLGLGKDASFAVYDTQLHGSEIMILNQL